MGSTNSIICATPTGKIIYSKKKLYWNVGQNYSPIVSRVTTQIRLRDIPVGTTIHVNEMGLMGDSKYLFSVVKQETGTLTNIPFSSRRNQLINNALTLEHTRFRKQSFNYSGHEVEIYSCHVDDVIRGSVIFVD
jgi:hypothetical protein